MQIYRLRLPHRRLYQPLGGTPWRGFLDLLIPEGQSPSEVQRLLSAEGLFNMEHPFPVCNDDDDDNHQHMRIVFSSASSTDHPSVAVANNKDLSSIDRCGRQLAHRGAEDICNFVTLHDDGTMWKAKEAQRCGIIVSFLWHAKLLIIYVI